MLPCDTDLLASHAHFWWQTEQWQERTDGSMGGKFESAKFLLEKYSGISQIANWIKKLSGVYSCSCSLESAIIPTWKKILLMAIMHRTAHGIIPMVGIRMPHDYPAAKHILQFGQFCARKNVLVQLSYTLPHAVAACWKLTSLLIITYLACSIHLFTSVQKQCHFFERGDQELFLQENETVNSNSKRDYFPATHLDISMFASRKENYPCNTILSRK